MSSLRRFAGYDRPVARAEEPENGAPEFLPQPIQTAGAAQQIAEQIRRGILRGELRPGRRLPPESELAAEFAVSRGTIRETMKLLSAAQLVESTRGATGGTFVRLPEPESVAATIGDSIRLWFNAGNTSLAEINDARAWIERGCVVMAARNRSDADLEQIRATVVAMEAPGIDIDEMLAIDIDFHVAVCQAAHNAVLELAMNAIHLVRPYTNTMLVPLLPIATIAEHHRAIYEGLRAADVDSARAAFDRHIVYLDEVREQALSDQRPEDVPVAQLTSEAHPAFERIRERVLTRREG